MLNQWHHQKEHPQISLPQHFHGVKGPLAELLACSPIQTTSKGSTKKGQRDAHAKCLVVAVRRAWQPRQLHLCARRRIAARTRMALQQCPQLSKRNNEAIHGWPCMSVHRLRISIGQDDGWRSENWSIRHASGERRYGWLDLSTNIPIFFLVT